MASRILQYESGSEHSPGDARGEDALGVRADDTFWLVNKHRGARKSWVGNLRAGTHAELERLLVATGFPVVPAHPIPGGSAMRSLSYKDQSASLAWHAGGELPGYRELFAVLDSIVNDTHEGVVRGAIASVALQDPNNPSPSQKLFSSMFAAGPRPAPRKPPEPTLEPRALDGSDNLELRHQLRRGRGLIGVPEPGAEPRLVAEAVARVIERQRAGNPGDAKAIVALGMVFGDAVARATGWSWWMLSPRAGEPPVPVLVPQNRAHVLFPIGFVGRQVRGPNEPTAMLVFNMLASGALPPGVDGALAPIL